MARSTELRSTGFRVVRNLGITLGALLILALGVYGPATLVGPLPTTAPRIADVAEIVPTVGAPTLPATGASALVAGDSDSVLAKGGEADAVPLGGATKIITALVVLDAKPVEAGKPGPSITVTADDYADFVRYISQSARSVSFLPGETWTERSYLQSMLLGSSNNHADALARWAFGSVEKYVTAANAWLATQGFSGTTVVDATGLAGGSVGTASDLALLASKAFANPVLDEIMGQEEATVTGSRTVQNLAAYRAEDGIQGLSRSFTDDAGLCFLFQVSVPAGDETVQLAGAFLREPDYETLDADLSALVASATANLRSTTIVTEGDSFATYTTPWGDTAHAVATKGESRMLWLTQPVTHEVSVAPVTISAAEKPVGSVTFHTQSGNFTVPLVLDSRLSDPGPLWRLTNPVPVISAFLKSRGL
jgi:D-alanyl-D-alanine carboxypeptidase (penicillin-binding protein 5/6)